MTVDFTAIEIKKPSFKVCNISVVAAVNDRIVISIDCSNKVFFVYLVAKDAYLSKKMLSSIYNIDVL